MDNARIVGFVDSSESLRFKDLSDVDERALTLSGHELRAIGVSI
jgi:hypothetical protein